MRHSVGAGLDRNLWDRRCQHSFACDRSELPSSQRRELLYLNAVWSKKALTHELAHAWHLTHWPAKHTPIVDAYTAAKASGLYLRVKDDKGKLIDKAYATHNPLEYFAELSAIYFVGGNYYPFDRTRLIRYDPVRTRMLRNLWASSGSTSAGRCGLRRQPSSSQDA